LAAAPHHPSGPLEQFAIEPLLPLHLGRYDLSFTNSALFMLLAAGLVTVLMTLSVKRGALVPSRLQSLAELFYEFIANMVRDNAGHDARRFTPLVFSLFMFILLGNLLGMIPYSFTFTSHIIVTFALALTVFLIVTVVAFAWLRWATLRGRRTYVYAFRVPQSRSQFTIYDAETRRTVTAGYHGLIYADPASGDMARLEAHMDAPKDFPFQEDAFEIDYGQVDIAGQSFLLPVKSLGWVRDGKLLTRNEIEFGEYRKYGADATVIFGGAQNQ